MNFGLFYFLKVDLKFDYLNTLQYLYLYVLNVFF